MSSMIQAVYYNEKPLPVEWVMSATYIETMDLSGPKLIITFQDAGAFLKDNAGISERKGVISVDLTDSSGGDEVFLTERFTIEHGESVANGIYRLQCISEAVSKIKRYSSQSVIYPPAAPSETIKLITGGDVVSSVFPESPSYHLLAGVRPSRLLKEMAVELGAVIYYSRGKWYLTSLDDLAKLEPVATYYHNKAGEAFVVASVRSLGREVAGDLTRKRYAGWHANNGLIADLSQPFIMCGLDTEEQIANLSRLLLPELSFQIIVNATPALTIGMSLNIEWHRPENKDNPINEAMPSRVLLGKVSHHYERQRYVQGVETWSEVLPNE